MKEIPCGNPNCSERRIRFDQQDVRRTHAMVIAPDDHVGKGFCSITCACMAGYYDVTKGWIKDPKTE